LELQVAFLQEQSSNMKSTSTRQTQIQLLFGWQQASCGGMFSGIASSIPFANHNASPPVNPQRVNQPSGGGFFVGMGSHLPFGNPNTPQLHIHSAAFAD
jgi:hypothetical protein